MQHRRSKLSNQFDVTSLENDVAFGIRLAEACGYTIMNHGLGTPFEGWFALLPGETVLNDDDENHNYLGFFSSLDDLVEELSDTLTDTIINESGIDEFLWDIKTPEEKLAYAASLGSRVALLEAGKLLENATNERFIHPEILEKIESDEFRLLFHGTANDFDSFSASWSPGGDCNSALGTHFSEFPGEALEYAQTSFERGEGARPIVMVAAVPALNPYGMTDYFEFFGYDDDGGQLMNHEGFSQKRDNLLRIGHDIIDYEDGEGVISVALRPENVTILAKLSPEQAERLDGLIRKNDDPFSGEHKIVEFKKLLDGGFNARKKTPVV